MGTTVYWTNVSVDLLIERDPSDHTDAGEGGEWIRIDEELFDSFNRRARALAMMVEGRVVYEMMERYWPDARTDDSLPAHLREWAHIWTDIPKLLVSRTRTHAEHNTRIVSGRDAIEQLARVREQTSGTIAVGGANLATQLLRHGLLDELMLFTHPAILGVGRPLFDGVDQPIILDLLEQERFTSGVTMHRYAVRTD
jgi:dihydrofolate reductase